MRQKTFDIHSVQDIPEWVVAGRAKQSPSMRVHLRMGVLVLSLVA